MSREDSTKNVVGAAGGIDPDRSGGGYAASVEAMRQLAAIAGDGVADIGQGMPYVRICPDLLAITRRLGEIAPRLDVFRRGEELVYFDDVSRSMRPMTGRVFRTWINGHVIMAAKFDKDGQPMPGTLRGDDAAAILESPDFRRGCREVVAVNQVRLPVIRAVGGFDLLPWGYDSEFQVFTVPGGLEYDAEIDIAAAKVWLGRQTGDFPFADDRSKSANLAAMLALYAKHLPGGNSLRPGFLFLGNQPGCGKSLLAKMAISAVNGYAASAKLKRGEDLDKELESFARARVPYIFLDNIYGGIQSASIDQMLTSKRSAGRAMGGHEVFEADNTALLIVTGNGLDLNEDAARRFTVIDLFETGELGQRPIHGELLDDDTLETPEWRKRALAALCAFVRNWHDKGRPESKVTVPTFERFTANVGGIVEAAGFSPPFEKAVIPDAISAGKADFVELLRGIVEDMGGDRLRTYKLPALAMIARARGVYVEAVGTQEDGKRQFAREEGLSGEQKRLAQDEGLMTTKQRQAFGYALKGQLGKSHREIRGVVIEFGKRAQSRHAEFTVTVEPVQT